MYIKKWSKYFCIVLILLATVGIILYLALEKKGMHVDEYLSYILSNNESITVQFENNVKLDPDTVFDVFFYANEFNIVNVWKNQKNDVHPPVYYLLFHISGLILNNFFGLKAGILINIVFHVCNILMIYKIVKNIFSREYLTLLGAGLYAVMPIVLGNVLFMRMYVLLAFGVLLLTYLLVQSWEKALDKTFYIKLGIISVLGVLTHYYFLIYLFYCCLIWGIFKIIKKEWKEIFSLILTMICSGIISIAIFPGMLQHIFFGYRGKESVEKLLNSSYLENLKFYGEVVNQVFGGMFGICIIVVVGILLFKRMTDKNYITFDSKWFVVILPCVLYFFTVSKIAVMQASRYIAPLYGVEIILLVGTIKIIADVAKQDKAQKIIGICVAGLVLINGWREYTWPELYKEAENGIKIAEEYGENNSCIYIYNYTWRGLPTYQEFIQYKDITFIDDNELESVSWNKVLDEHQVIYFTKNFGEEQTEKVLNQIVEDDSRLEKWTYLYDYQYNVAYYVE